MGTAMSSDLVRIHHADYQDDLPFWIKHTEGFDPILEVGCGHGRVTLPLLDAGRQVVGVDRDRDSLAYLASVLEDLDDQRRRRISLSRGDILDFQPESPFGSVIVPCNTYSTFSAQDRPRLLDKVSSILRAGGLLIASLPNPRQTAELWAGLRGNERLGDLELERVLIHPGTGYPVQVSSRLRAARESLLWDWIYDHLHPDGSVERYVATVEHFPASFEEILSELEERGFPEVLCLGDYTGEPYGSESPYLIIICRARA